MLCGSVGKPSQYGSVVSARLDPDLRSTLTIMAISARCRRVLSYATGVWPPRSYSARFDVARVGLGNSLTMGRRERFSDTGSVLIVLFSFA